MVDQSTDFALFSAKYIKFYRFAMAKNSEIVQVLMQLPKRVFLMKILVYFKFDQMHIGANF